MECDCQGLSASFPKNPRTDPVRYVPVDCEFHDRLESACVLRQTVQLSLQTAQGAEVFEGKILDVLVQGDAEYVHLGVRGLVRLDAIRSIRVAPPSL